MTPPISQRADDMIVGFEVSSRAYFEKRLTRPEWPGGLSGVTWAIGYDGGYASPAKIKHDWGDRLPGAMVDAMVQCSGITGAAAHALLPRVRNSIVVTWDQAVAVYEGVDIPEWTDRVCRAIPGADRLTPDCLGVLDSLAYNRGCSFQMAGDRYREMRAIRSHIVAGELPQVSAEIRAMKRLWPDVAGLRIRRDKEADLWELGLRVQPAAQPVKARTSETPPPPALPPKAGGPEAGTGLAGGSGTAAAAHQAALAGAEPWVIAAIVAAGLVVTVATIAAVRARRAQPALARAKG